MSFKLTDIIYEHPDVLLETNYRTARENEHLRAQARISMYGDRRWPPLHNIPMPRTEEGDRLRALFREVWPVTRAFDGIDYASVERRILWLEARSEWTLQDCYWRDGEE